MTDCSPFARIANRWFWRTSLWASVALLGAATSSMAAEPSHAQLPDTPVGRLAGELIQHANNDSPEQIQKWARSILSASMSDDDKAGFVADLASAARDGGGLDVFDVRTDPHQPGLLQVAVQTRRGGQRALFPLMADSAHPDQLAQAALFPMGDPALYADWPASAVTHADMARLIHAALDRLVRTQDFSGCVTVRDGDDTVLNECRGLAERRFNVAATDQTRFHIGSMDKMFTGVAIAQLVEGGKLSWDDTLAKLVPEYPDQAAAGRITVWELLHHTAGLGDFLVPDYLEHSERFINPADYLGLIARQPLVGEPGKQWIYSNAGYMLLGRIIENVSGEGYFSYIQRHIFTPAHMESSGFDGLDEIVPGLAVGYYHDGLFSRTWKADWLKLGYKGGPAGGGYSNNTDLLRFAAALRGGKLVGPATLARMFDDETPAGPGGYAAGFGDRLSHDRHIRGHSGGIEGTTANLQMVWETGGAVALTSNQGPSENWMLAERIADLLAAGGAKR
jgi:CubicO group peptidase (beta-lactamase class C family)